MKTIYDDSILLELEQFSHKIEEENDTYLYTSFNLDKKNIVGFTASVVVKIEKLLGVEFVQAANHLALWRKINE